MSKYDFEKDLALADKINQTEIVPFLEKDLGYCLQEVLTQEMQNAGLDFIGLRDNKLIGIEVKVDRHEFKNIFVEEQNLKTGNPGWIAKGLDCPYYLAYYFILTGDLLLFNMDLFRKWYSIGQNFGKLYTLPGTNISGRILPIASIGKSTYRRFCLKG